jgi:hypothetical protein
MDKENPEETEKQPEEKPEGKSGEKSGQKIGDKLAGARDKARGKLDGAGERAKHKLEETGEKAREKAREAREKANEKIAEARQKARHKLEGSGEKAREARQKAREKLGEAGAKARDTGGKLMGVLAEGIRRIGESQWFRSISAQTWAGVGLAVLFLVFMFFEQLNYRWWVMLPLGGAGLYVLGKQWYGSGDRKGMDARVCFFAFVVLALMVVYRDALLAEMMLDRMETVKGIKEVFE